jgi:hypothetical protein
VWGAGGFEPAASSADPIARRSNQVIWRDPGSGYVRRNVPPSSHLTSIQIVEVVFPPGAHVAYESAARQPIIHHQVWVLEGSIAVTVGASSANLMPATASPLFSTDRRPIAIAPARPARYAVVIVTGSNRGS